MVASERANLQPVILLPFKAFMFEQASHTLVSTPLLPSLYAARRQNDTYKHASIFNHRAKRGLCIALSR